MLGRHVGHFSLSSTLNPKKGILLRSLVKSIGIEIGMEFGQPITTVNMRRDRRFTDSNRLLKN